MNHKILCMKRLPFPFLALLLPLSLALTSCITTNSGSFGANTDIDPWTEIDSRHNVYDLIVAENGIQYTIDYSTPDGRLKLKNISLSDAKHLALSEAAIANNCAMIVRPKYTFLKEGKQILRITVFGFPANYRNADRGNDYVPEGNRSKTTIDVKVNR